MKAIFHPLTVLVFLTLFTPLTIFSQNINLDDMPGCLVSDVSGKVSYLERGSTTAKAVKVGTVLPEDATVTVGKKSSLTLTCDDRQMTVSQKGTYQMAGLAKDVASKGTASKFAQMVFSANGYAIGDTTKKKGWGSKDSIFFLLPTNGKVPLQPTTFSWTPLNTGATYKLIVYQNEKDKPLLSVMTHKASFSFDPEQLALQAGQTCHAQVMLAGDGKTIASEVVDFSFAPFDAAESALTLLKTKNEYLKSSPAQKLLMEAIELESREFNSLATGRYQQAMKKDGIIRLSLWTIKGRWWWW